MEAYFSKHNCICKLSTFLLILIASIYTDSANLVNKETSIASIDVIQVSKSLVTASEINNIKNNISI